MSEEHRSLDVGGDDSAGDDLDLPEQVADEFRGVSTGFLVVDGSRRVVGAAGITGRLADLVADRDESPLTVLHSDIADRASEAVDRAFESGEPVSVGFTSDSNERFVLRAVPVEEVVVLQLSDLTDSVRIARELKRTRETLDTLEDGVYTLDEAFVITSINDAVTEITGYSRDELVGSHASKLAGDETLSMATEIIEQLRGSDIGLIESTIQGATGESIPIETRFSTVEFANGDRRRVGVFRDIRERRQNEHTLAALNRSARTLLRADDEGTVCETIVDVARSVWPDATAVTYSFDTDSSTLVPVAAAGVDPDPVGPGTEKWRAFATGTAAVSESAAEPSDRSADRSNQQPTGRVIRQDEDGTEDGDSLFASLEEYGLLTVTFGPDTSVDTAVESVELLAANAVAALGRVDREAELARRRSELADQNDQLERARAFNDLLRRINGALVEADSLGEIAAAVCDHLADADRIAFVWFGETYRSSDGLRPVARAGSGEGYLDGLDVVGADPGSVSTETEPSVRAVASRSQVVVPEVSAGLHGSEWRERALVRGFRSIASIPVQYNDLPYGVLSVYTDRPGAFDGTLGELLDDLGETVGNAINAIETKRSLRSESVVELELRIEDPDAVSARLAGRLGEPIRIDGVVPADEDRSVLYLRSEADPAGLPESVLAVKDIRSVGEQDDPRSAVTVTDRTVVSRLTDYSAEVEQFRAEPGGIELTATLPRSADVRLLIEALEADYTSVELRKRRERSPGASHRESISPSVTELLTEKQYEALRTAYLAGYFEWPRASTGEDVADTLGITQPTFNRHLRTTERKLFSVLFDG